MFEIVTIILAVTAVAYVAMPLITQKQSQQQHSSTIRLKLDELLYQQSMLQNTIEDLEFDYQTGKLSTADYESLVSEHQKSQTGIDARIKQIGGISSEELVAQLEDEISKERQKIAPKKPITCTQCDKPLKLDDKFCSSCGRQVS